MALIESNDHSVSTHEIDLDGMPVFGLSALVRANSGEAVESYARKTVDELAGELLTRELVAVSADPNS